MLLLKYANTMKTDVVKKNVIFGTVTFDYANHIYTDSLGKKIELTDPCLNCGAKNMSYREGNIINTPACDKCQKSILRLTSPLKVNASKLNKEWDPETDPVVKSFRRR